MQELRTPLPALWSSCCCFPHCHGSLQWSSTIEAPHAIPYDISCNADEKRIMGNLVGACKEGIHPRHCQEADATRRMWENWVLLSSSWYYHSSKSPMDSNSWDRHHRSSLCSWACDFQCSTSTGHHLRHCSMASRRKGPSVPLRIPECRLNLSRKLWRNLKANQTQLSNR